MSEPFTLASAGRAIEGAISRLVHDVVTPALPPTEERTAAIARYRAAREQTISIIRDLTQTQANFKPAPEAWSVSQVVEHLLLTEDLYRTQMQNAVIEHAANAAMAPISIFLSATSTRRSHTFRAM